MTQKQKHLLQLLREIDEICKKHNLRYVMAGGSLIGVVRNEGFIPWDDDVDIYMPLDDWRKFVELSKTEFPPNRNVQCVDVDRSYTNTFPRYVDTDSCAIHKHQLIGDDQAGEIIDILTLDPIPPDDKEYEKYRTHMMIYSELINVAIVYGNRWEIPASMYLKYLLSYMILGKDRTLKKLEKIMFSYKEEECNRFAMRWGGCPFLFDKDMMFPVKYMKFEGLDVMVPQRVSDYLIWHYGDEWSYIPPHDERSSHDAITVEGGHYQELRAEYMPKVDARKIRIDSVIRKFYYLLTAKKGHRLVEERKLLQARSTELELKTVIQKGAYDLRALVEQRNFAVLNQIFENYYQIQLSADFIGREDFRFIHQFYHPVLLKVEDDVFWAAMMTLFYTERVAKAYRMLQIREKMDHVTEEMRRIMEDVVLFRKAACHYEMKEKAESEKICRELLERYPYHAGCMKLLCRLVMEKGEKAEKEAEEFLASALEAFPGDGYFQKYQADLLMQKGQEEAALVLYAEARKNTKNGITHLEIDKMMSARKPMAIERFRKLLAEKEADQALAWAELWERLLPEDELLRAQRNQANVFAAQNEEELEQIEVCVCERIRKLEEDFDEESSAEVMLFYQQAIMQSRKRLGYAEELAEIYADIQIKKAPSDLEKLAQNLESRLSLGEDAAAYKVLGDVRMKQGMTKAAFAAYLEAAKYAEQPYLKGELDSIFMKDLVEGSKKAAVYAKNGDASEFLNHWLDKYGTLEELQKLTKRLVK